MKAFILKNLLVWLKQLFAETLRYEMNTGVELFRKALICVKESSDESNVSGIVSVYMVTSSVRWWHKQQSSVSVAEVLKYIVGGGGAIPCMQWIEKGRIY